MVLVRPTFVLAALSGAFPSRAELPAFGIQLVSRGNVRWAQKAAWFRNVPYTAINPHTGQMEIRVMFGETAREGASKGAEGIAREVGGRVVPGVRGKLVQLPDGRILPPVAAYIAVKMKGKRAPDRMPPESYPSKLKRSVHTMEELRAALESAGIRVTV